VSAPIEAKFPFDADVMAEAFDVHRGVRRWTKWLRVFAWLALAAGVWLIAKERSYEIGGVVAGVAAVVIVWPRLARALWLNAISAHPFFGKEVRCRFDTQGFVMIADNQGIKLAWDDAFKIVEGKYGYLIYPKSGAFYYIPARGFATEIDAERVKGFFLSEKMRRT
jgi:hypothetical protein